MSIGGARLPLAPALQQTATSNQNSYIKTVMQRRGILVTNSKGFKSPVPLGRNQN